MGRSIDTTSHTSNVHKECKGAIIRADSNTESMKEQRLRNSSFESFGILQAPVSSTHIAIKVSEVVCLKL